MPKTEQDIRERFASETIENSVFFVPFFYLYRVRHGSVGKFASWLLLYPFLTFFYAATLNLWQLYFPFFASFFLTLTATFSIYEVGYIFNDAFAIEREQKPALRLYPHNLIFAKKRIVSILACRISIAILCLVLLQFFQPKAVVWTLLACLIFIVAIFAIYNRIRNKFSAFVYPFLVFSRYLPLVLPYIYQSHFGQILLLLYLAFPLPNALERFSMETHRFRFVAWLIPTERAKTYFRIGYYATISAILSCILPPRLLLPFYVLLIYRTILAIIVHYKPPKRYLRG